MDEREELIETIEFVIRFSSLTNPHQLAKRIASTVSAPLPDGSRWMLVHPDEMIRRDQLEQVGWVYEPHHEDPDPTLCFVDSRRGWTPRGGKPVYRVPPAVEKENDQ